MKTSKRIFSMILICTMLLPMMMSMHVNADDATTGGHNTYANSAYLHYEDFNNKEELESAGWSNLDSYILNDGKLQSTASNKYMTLAGNPAANWSSYAIEADVTLTSDEIDGNKSSGRLVGITVITNAADETKNYELSVFYSTKAGTTLTGDELCDVTFWDRTLQTSEKTVSKSMSKKSVKIGTTVNLKMMVNEDKIVCYLNNQEVGSYAVEGLSTQTIALHGVGNVGTFDNLRVYQTEPDILYYEDYDGATDLESAGWSNLDSYILADGQLQSTASNKYTTLVGNTAAANWATYVFEADVTLTPNEIDGNKSSGRLAGITLITNTADETKNYELSVFYSAKAGTTLTGDEMCDIMFWDRTLQTSDKTVSKTMSKKSVKIGTTVNLKMMVNEDGIVCYLNNQEVGSYAVEGLSTKTIALHGVGNACTFDNVFVRANEKVESNTEYLFEEYFEDDNATLVSTGWDIGAEVTLDNGQLLIDNNQTMYLTGNSSAANWSDYILEADVVMTDQETSTAGTKLVGLVAGVNSSKKGYEFALIKNGETYRCWLRDYTDSDKPILQQPKYDFSLNESVKLKMVVEGNIIQCYINDEMVIEKTVGSETILGTIGLRANGVAGKFDNILVSAINPESDDENEDTGNEGNTNSEYLFEEYFEKNNSALVKTGWDIGEEVKLQGGQLLIDNNKKMYLTGYEGAADWSNYTVEAEVMMIVDDTTKASTQLVGIEAGVNSSKKGYEFALLYDGKKTYCWLYDRINGKQLATKNFTFDLDTTVTLKMELNGNIIQCYANETLLISYTVNGEAIKGTIGLRANGYDGIFDNVLVYPVEEPIEVTMLPDVRGKDVWFSDDFSGMDALTDRGWSEDYNITKGQLVLGGSGEEKVYVTGIEGYNDWDNYTAQVDVTMSDDPDETTSVSLSTAVLCVRTTGPDNGYEFGMTMSTSTESGSFWLRLRNTKTTLAESKVIKPERGKNYNLKVVLNGNLIECYVDDELLFSYVDEANVNPKGSIGLRKSGYSAYFDNVMVYQNQASPKTGDYVRNQVQIAVGIFAVSGLALLFVISKKRKFLGEREI